MKKLATLGLGALIAACAASEREEPPSNANQAESSFMGEVVGPDVISTALNQTFPSEDPLESALWFSEYDDDFDRQTLKFSVATADGWSEPRIPRFSGRWGDRAPRFDPSGSALYFTSNRPTDGGGVIAGDMNLWRVPRVGSEWGEPVLVAAPVHSVGADIHGSITDSAIWLPSVRDDSFGRSDVYRISLDSNEAHHLPAPINDAHSQPDIYVSRDERWMILTVTDHPSGLGGDDLFFSRREGTGWTVPENLGPAVNSPDYEYGASLSRDGRWLYFTSHRDGPAHVYRVELTAIGIEP